MKLLTSLAILLSLPSICRLGIRPAEGKLAWLPVDRSSSKPPGSATGRRNGITGPSNGMHRSRTEKTTKKYVWSDELDDVSSATSQSNWMPQSASSSSYFAANHPGDMLSAGSMLDKQQARNLFAALSICSSMLFVIFIPLRVYMREEYIKKQSFRTFEKELSEVEQSDDPLNRFLEIFQDKSKIPAGFSTEHINDAREQCIRMLDSRIEARDAEKFRLENRKEHAENEKKYMEDELSCVNAQMSNIVVERPLELQGLPGTRDDEGSGESKIGETESPAIKLKQVMRRFSREIKFGDLSQNDVDKIVLEKGLQHHLDVLQNKEENRRHAESIKLKSRELREKRAQHKEKLQALLEQIRQTEKHREEDVRQREMIREEEDLNRMAVAVKELENRDMQSYKQSLWIGTIVIMFVSVLNLWDRLAFSNDWFSSCSTNGGEVFAASSAGATQSWLVSAFWPGASTIAKTSCNIVLYGKAAALFLLVSILFVFVSSIVSTQAAASLIVGMLVYIIRMEVTEMASRAVWVFPCFCLLDWSMYRLLRVQCSPRPRLEWKIYGCNVRPIVVGFCMPVLTSIMATGAGVYISCSHSQRYACLENIWHAITSVTVAATGAVDGRAF